MTALLADDSKFGFIVMDGNCALFGSLSGNTREVLHKFTVDLPKKHGNDLESNVALFGSVVTVLYLIRSVGFGSVLS